MTKAPPTELDSYHSSVRKEKSKSKTIVVLLRMIEDFIYHTRVRLTREKGWHETKAGTRKGLAREKGWDQKRAGTRKGLMVSPLLVSATP
jgi:hypothetical protein